jgi:hypothetical protein
MQRRRLLQGAGAIGGTLLAGCLGESQTEFNLKQAGKPHFDANSDGYLYLNVTVSNVGNERQSGKVYVTAQLNDEELVRVREVTLDAHQTTRVTFTYDVKYENVTKFTPKVSIRRNE